MLNKFCIFDISDIKHNKMIFYFKFGRKPILDASELLFPSTDAPPGIFMREVDFSELSPFPLSNVTLFGLDTTIPSQYFMDTSFSYKLDGRHPPSTLLPF